MRRVFVDKKFSILRKRVKHSQKKVMDCIIADHNADICVLCGSSDDITREHIIPQWAFESNAEKSLINKKKKSKIERWQSIATAAAKQSKRTSVPKVCEIASFKEMLKFAEKLDLFLVPYECAEGMNTTKEALKQIKGGMSIGILIGPEGGFEPAEIELALGSGGKIISLGQRILRCETAAITAISMCMLYSEMEL